MAASDIELRVDDWISQSVPQCRICHEEEGDSQNLEAPCACSGTLKFAHRECIQRWCDEKGNTTCEICLEKFEPGYTATLPLPSKRTRLADIAVTIRESLEVLPRQHNDLNYRRSVEDIEVDEEIIDTSFADCPSSSERTANWCRSIVLILAALVLVRHLISVLTGVPDHYPLTLLALVLVRLSGIVLPLYLMMQTIGLVQKWMLQRQQSEHNESEGSDIEAEDDLLP